MLGHIAISDINEALPHALPLLLQHGVSHTAASVANEKATIEWPGVFVTEYRRPQRNVLFDPVRDANPFFHYLESMWILMGRNDVKFLAHVLPRMADYSDDGTVFHGAYGYRMRHHFFGDQLERAIKMLRTQPTTRQCVVTIWDPACDLGAKTRDMPCNDMLMFKVRKGKLNLTVCNRSNDAIWGCYGANAVQFSMLQMYLAAHIGVKVGNYVQVSDSFHVYSDNPYWQWFTERYQSHSDEWAQPLHESRAIYENIGDQNLFEDHIEKVDDELRVFFKEADAAIDDGGRPIHQFAKSLAVRTAVQMWNTLSYHRVKQHEVSRTEVWNIELPDWQLAAREWLNRRQAK